ncbi:ABC-type oligopeptide transport system, periplasmic component [Lacticaseibacillus pantheris DSM 15945 = JCM 12539 = NBRC 106106]|uniref:ABC-type oligopeptide transport system, periplasmic component n=1 Tax=Lacticaseibacillus pantheris DSM 15945 = JCM 12539 = NBRC 106106 TaxID=1423783 RepID=A0A0R1U4W6_9LACO|nr:peptide ABC transporter substrate-binding protein [Lacticaseibacillus pantheris]KRL88110.1 ABC-type oligopeptide transport system, periplasmic component [Lacticaseibacillus pantheris DSM 15945 = JCM 12539 = NBRC 106106]
MKKKPLLLGSMLTTMVVLLAACGSSSSSSSKSQSMTRMVKDVIQTMDPAQATDVISGQTLQDTTAGLLRFKGKNLEPDLASKKPTVSKDQKTYTFTIRKGAKWSDGKEITAQDFVYSWERAADPKTKSEYSYIFSGIKNADDIIAGKKDPSTMGVKAEGKYKLVVTLDRVMPYFQKMITLQTFNPVEKSVVKKYGSKFGTASKYITASGPYKLTNWNGSNNTWTEVKNKSYWNAKNVKLDKIKTTVVKDTSTAVNLFQSNKLDDAVISGDTATQMKNDKSYKTMVQGRTTYLEMEQKKVPAFKNQKIRQALSLSINRTQFINKVLGDGSRPVYTILPYKSMYNSDGTDIAAAATKGVKQYNDYDLSKAKQLFKEGMKEAGLTSFSFTITSDDTDAAKSTTEYLQNAFEKLSSSDAKVTVKTKSVPFKTRITLSEQHNFDMVVSGWQGDFPDAISFLDLETTGNSYNFGQWSNAEYDKYVQASKTTDATSTSKRWEDLVKATQILAKDNGVIPLYQTGEAHLTNTKISNYDYGPNNMIDMESVTKK